MDSLHQDLLEAHYYGTSTDDDEGEYDSDVAMFEEWIVVFRTNFHVISRNHLKCLGDYDDDLVKYENKTRLSCRNRKILS